MSRWTRILTLDAAPQGWSATRRSLAQALLLATLCTVALTAAMMLLSPDTVYQSRVSCLWHGKTIYTSPPQLSKRRFALLVGVSGLAGLAAGLGGHCLRMRRRPADEA
ncbi:hypothetical protein HQ560_13390 [bacterium]|nr:hypothetical protein [bacterium]